MNVACFTANFAIITADVFEVEDSSVIGSAIVVELGHVAVGISVVVTFVENGSCPAHARKHVAAGVSLLFSVMRRAVMATVFSARNEPREVFALHRKCDAAS